VSTIVAPGSLVADAELDAMHGIAEQGLPAFLTDLERLVNVDCGSYTPAATATSGLAVTFSINSATTIGRRRHPLTINPGAFLAGSGSPPPARYFFGFNFGLESSA